MQERLDELMTLPRQVQDLNAAAAVLEWAQETYLPDGTANHTESSFERRLGLSHVRWERVPLRTVIATDVLSLKNIQETHRKGVNAVFRDGHVSFLSNPELLDQAARLDQYKFINDAWKRDILTLYDWLDARY